MFLREPSFLTFSTMFYILIAINATSEMFIAIFALISAFFMNGRMNIFTVSSVIKINILI